MTFGKTNDNYAWAEKLYKNTKISIKGGATSEKPLSPRAWCKKWNRNYAVIESWIYDYQADLERIRNNAYPW